MMVSFDTNILVYATLSVCSSKMHDPRPHSTYQEIARPVCFLRGEPLAEFSSVAIHKAGIEVDAVRTTIDAWRAVLPVQGTEDDDLSAALNAVKNNRLGCDLFAALGGGTTGRRTSSGHRGPAGRL